MVARAWFRDFAGIAVVAALAVFCVARSFADELNSGSVHAAQEAAVAGESATSEAGESVHEPVGAGASKPSSPERAAGRSVIGDDFIVFGYLQSTSQIQHTRWEALTHVASTFVTFNSAGNLNTTSLANNWTNRSAYLRAGGAAQAAGVKVIMVINSFDDAAGGAIQLVFQDPARRANLVADVRNALINDAYAHGVSVDVEFTWTAATRDGMTEFFKELRAALPSQYEVSVYTHPTYSSTLWNMNATTGITPVIDYMIYSGYDFASGNTPHAHSDYNSILPRLKGYFDAGLPPEKMVVALAAYGGRWTGTTTYDVLGTDSTAIGVTDGIFNTTLNTENNGPQVLNYKTGDESGWYTTVISGTNYCSTFDTPEAMRVKIGNSVSYNDPSGVYAGRRLRGVGFWSLYWMAETSSYDPITAATASKTRTYTHYYQACQELLKAPGTTQFLITGFEGSDPRWGDPNNSPDSVADNAASAVSIVAAPAGAGRPASTTNAARVRFDFAAAATQRLFFRHEILGYKPTGLAAVIDTNAVTALLEPYTKLSAHIYTPAAYANRTIRMVVKDKNRQLEAGPATTLNATGWRRISFDLTDAASVSAYTTAEPGWLSGNGVIESDGNGARDVALVGFVIEGGNGTAATGDVYIDEVVYERAAAGGLVYKINEFAYASAAGEYVEIYGPPGPIPAGMQLRAFVGTSAVPSKTFDLSGIVIPASGVVAIGDAALGAAIASSTGFGDAADDLPNGNPSGLQLIHTTTGAVYDSVVYEGFGGIGAELLRPATRGLTDEGYPWVGEVAANAYSVGRYPDGADTEVNGVDFGVMPRSIGAPNGNSLGTLPQSVDFSGATPALFQTFNTISVVDPTTKGIVAAGPGATGNAYRCVDTTGGGLQAYIGDAALGAGTHGYAVSGRWYVQPTTALKAAQGVGICGRQGSRFFTATAADALASSYESGYWILYENEPGVALNDGLADAPQVFRFVWAHNDNNRFGRKVTELGSATLAQTGASAGAWTDFQIGVNSQTGTLTASVNGVTLYSGAIPAGGPTTGAFQVGYRETDTGAPTVAGSDGTWVDSLLLTPSSTAATPTPSLTPTASATVSLTPSPSPSATPTASPSVSASPSATPSASVTPAPSISPSATPTASLTASPTASTTPTASVSPSLTPSPSPTASSSPSATPTVSLSPTASPTPTISQVPTVSPTPSPTPRPDTDDDGYSDEYETDHGADPANPASTPFTLDVNGDGFVNTLDAIELYRAVRGGPVAPALNRPDVTDDGVVDVSDALRLYRWLVGVRGYEVIR